MLSVTVSRSINFTCVGPGLPYVRTPSLRETILAQEITPLRFSAVGVSTVLTGAHGGYVFLSDPVEEAPRTLIDALEGELFVCLSAVRTFLFRTQRTSVEFHVVR